MPTTRHKLVSTVALLACVGNTIGSGNNVCESINDYFNLSVNPRCWENPDVWSNPVDMAKRHGYPILTYNVTTDDDYILTVYRIPHGINKTQERKQPVLIQHGAFQDAAVWVDIGERSLAFQLADKGYDVWLGNTRGNAYSTAHKQFRYNTKQYWNYSLDELGKYDVSAELKLIKDVTGTPKKIIYIGHSMGTTISYIYAISKAEEAKEMLAGIISMAPVAYMDKLPSARLVTPFAGLLKKILNSLGIYGLSQYRDSQRKALKLLCLLSPPQIRLCKFLTFAAFGFDYSQFQAQDVPVYFSYWPSGLSVDALVQYAQIANSHKFRAYDHGKEKNLRIYGQKEPPDYELSKITVPVYLFHAQNDFLAPKWNVQKLYDELTVEKKEKILVPEHSSIKFNHIDFMYAKDIKELLYPRMFQVIEDLSE